MSQATPPEGTAPDVGAGDADASLEERAEQAPTPSQDNLPSNPPDSEEPNQTGDQADHPEDKTPTDDNSDGKAASGNDTEPFPRKARDRQRPPRPTVVVRYGAMRSIGEFKHNFDRPIARGTKLVIRSERGVELGEVIAPVCDEFDGLHLTSDKLKQFIRDNGADYPFRRDGRVLRLANPQDVIDYRHLEQSAREAATYCRQQIRELKLDMRMVAVEHLLGGERLVFYFAAEHRVDFRELVRRLASQYRTRIEMRQVGARDEARLVADYERCGQQCCCQSFLKDLRPVSMRMAKTQKATLDPSKISGRCGRLMCCLRYEDATYEVLRKKLPRKNTWVRTADGVVGRVVDTQIITQLVRLQLTDSTFVAVANEEIVERNMDAPPKPEPRAPQKPRPPRTPRHKRERLGAAAEAKAKAHRDTAASDTETPPDQDADAATATAEQTGEAEPSTTTKRRRRRRRRKKGPRDSSQAQGRAQSQEKNQNRDGSRDGQATSASQSSSGEKKPRRRRRRRKKDPRTDGGNSGGNSGGTSTPA